MKRFKKEYRVGDNMRNVAVTEGDKVEAHIKFGWEIDAYNITDIAEYVNAVSESDINNLVEEYYSSYNIILDGRDEAEFRKHVAVQAGREIGFERFLKEKKMGVEGDCVRSKITDKS